MARELPNDQHLALYSYGHLRVCTWLAFHRHCRSRPGKRRTGLRVRALNPSFPQCVRTSPTRWSA